MVLSLNVGRKGLQRTSMNRFLLDEPCLELLM